MMMMKMMGRDRGVLSGAHPTIHDGRAKTTGMTMGTMTVAMMVDADEDGGRRVGVGPNVVFVRILVVVTVMLLMVLLIMMKMVDVVEGGTGAGCWMRRGGVRMVVRRRTTVAVVRGPCHCRQRRRRLQVHALASAPAQPPPLLGYAIERVGRLGKGVRILMLLVFLVVPVVGGRGRCCSRRLRGRAGVTTDFPCSRGQGAREAHVSC